MQNKSPLSWVVVANKCEAKIYRITKFPKIEEVKLFEHPESRLHDSDLGTSKPGRSFQSGGSTRHAYQPETDPKVYEAMKFATEIGAFLATQERNGEFNRLYILAEPSFLGLLRQHYSVEIRKTIFHEIAKELHVSDVATIEGYLQNSNI